MYFFSSSQKQVFLQLWYILLQLVFGGSAKFCLSVYLVIFTKNKQFNQLNRETLIETYHFLLPWWKSWKSVVSSSLKVWLTSDVYSEASCLGWGGRVCGSPTGTAVPGKPCQVQVAWTKPYTTNGKCFCRVANLTRAVTETSLLCCQCLRRDCVFYSTCTFKQALRRTTSQARRDVCL